MFELFFFASLHTQSLIRSALGVYLPIGFVMLTCVHSSHRTSLKTMGLNKENQMSDNKNSCFYVNFVFSFIACKQANIQTIQVFRESHLRSQVKSVGSQASGLRSCFLGSQLLIFEASVTSFKTSHNVSFYMSYHYYYCCFYLILYSI